MKPQLEKTRRLLDSVSDTTITSRNPTGNGYGEVEETNINSNSNSIMKIMEKGCHVLVVDNLSSRINIGMGNAIESHPFVVGGYSFTIQLYPDGVHRFSHELRHVSLFIKNDSRKTAHVVIALHIRFCGSFDHTGRSSFHERKNYHQVGVLEPGQHRGVMNFTSRFSLTSILSPRDCVMIRATVGLVAVDQPTTTPPPPPPPPPAKSLSSSSSAAASSSIFAYERHRCILFKVGDRLYYALHSVITTRCPSLLSDYPQSNHNIVLISDVDTHVFEGVLWFLHNRTLHQQDRKAIANSEDDSFARKMLAAAHKFNLTDLTRQCQSFLYYGDSEVLDFYYGAESYVKELWGNITWLPQKMKELIPQKMKAA